MVSVRSFSRFIAFRACARVRTIFRRHLTISTRKTARINTRLRIIKAYRGDKCIMFLLVVSYKDN